MEVRPATLADLTPLRVMWEALWHELPATYPILEPDDKARWTADMATRLECQLHGDRTVCTFIAVDDDHTPLGFLCGRAEERLVGHPRRYWIVDHIYVVPAARGRWRGIGPALIEASLAYIEPLGIDVLELVAIAGDEHWKRRGWTPILTRYMTTTKTVLRHSTRKKVA